jgi:DNA invertase Pin-like site-specific DNA recombinase
MKTTQPSPQQQARLDALAALAEQARNAQRDLEQAIRRDIEEAGLRPLWVAKAIGVARSTVYLILERGQ